MSLAYLTSAHFNKFLYIHFMQSLPKVHDASIDKARIRIDPVEILQILGEQQGVIDSHTTALIEQYIEEGLRVSSPLGAFVLVEALENLPAEKIRIRGITFNTGKSIHKTLRHAEAYALFLVSAGPEPEHLARSLLQQGNRKRNRDTPCFRCK